MERDQQFTIMRDGQFYHTDQETVDVLNAVKKWDQHDGTTYNTAAQDVFARGLQTGRISEGPSHGHGYDPDAVRHSQGRASGYPATQEHYDPTYVERVVRPNDEAQRHDPEYRRAVSENLDDNIEAHQRAWRYEMGYERVEPDRAHDEQAPAPSHGHRR